MILERKTVTNRKKTKKRKKREKKWLLPFRVSRRFKTKRGEIFACSKISYLRRYVRRDAKEYEANSYCHTYTCRQILPRAPTSVAAAALLPRYIRCSQGNGSPTSPSAPAWRFCWVGGSRRTRMTSTTCLWTYERYTWTLGRYDTYYSDRWQRSFIPDRTYSTCQRSNWCFRCDFTNLEERTINNNAQQAADCSAALLLGLALLCGRRQ